MLDSVGIELCKTVYTGLQNGSLGCSFKWRLTVDFQRRSKFRPSVRSVYTKLQKMIYFLFGSRDKNTNMKHFGVVKHLLEEQIFKSLYFIRLAIWPTGLIFCLYWLFWSEWMILNYYRCRVHIRHDLLVIDRVRSYEYWSTVLAHDSFWEGTPQDIER